MPRRLRLPKSRHDRLPVSDALFHWLVYRDYRGARALVAPGASSWELFEIDGDRHRTAWRAIEDEAVALWAADYPGSRPASWWLWSAPSFRQIHGRFAFAEGGGRCWGTGLAYGAPVSCSDPPMVESSPAYLERLQLWLPHEREKVPSSAFAPQPFSTALTVAPFAPAAADDDDEDNDDDVADA